MLDLAARLALRGMGDVEPNPMVGAVIARDGTILGAGHHRRFGGLHAEREAIESCRRQGHDPRGSTMYVTLEPCCRPGKQPGCAPAIIEAGIARVIYARSDPHEKGRGGAEVLREAGIHAELSSASPLASRVSDPFVKRITTGLPWVIAKWAQTIDGRVATRTGQSQWISSEGSRARVHRLRSRVDAILTGIGTVLSDNPMLNARGVPRVRRLARRVVVDTHLDLPPQCVLAQTASRIPTTIACDKSMAVAHIALDRREALEAAGVDVMGVPSRLDDRVDLYLLFKALVDAYGITTVLVEAGPGLLGSLLDADLVDELRVYIAPLILGDAQARSAFEGRVANSLGQGRRFALTRSRRVGHDVELSYLRARE